MSDAPRRPPADGPNQPGRAPDRPNQPASAPDGQLSCGPRSPSLPAADRQPAPRPQPVRLVGPAPLFAFGELASAMDAARDLEAQGLWPVFASLTARSQTAGRGSHGRRWVSPPGHVYAALRLPAAAPFDGSQGSLALAMFMAWALEDLFGLAIAVKWPNDLLLDGRKAGGLLLSSRNGVIDAGVGLNLGAAPVDLERDPWAPPAGALPSSLGPPESLWAKVAENIQMRYNRQFAAAPPDWPARLAAQAEARLAGLGRTVEILAPSTAPPVLPRPGAADEPLRGRLVGLAPSGALKIDGPSGLTTVWSGTLRLKPAPSDA